MMTPLRMPLGGRGVMSPLGVTAGAAAVAPWYLSGGIAAANCLAAYTPKGAASLAASYDNNAAPGNGLADGTYDCTLGVAPTFDTSYGWSLNGSTQWLSTGIAQGAANWSWVVQFSDGATDSGYLLGAYDADNKMTGLRPSWITQIIANASTYHICAIANKATSGIEIIADRNLYVGGLLIEAIITDDSIPTTTVGIGQLVPVGSFWAGKIQRFACYNIDISSYAAALYAAMAAL